MWYTVQLRELLDIKQQQAGIVEAKAAITRADEAVMQGRSIVVFTVFSVVFRKSWISWAPSQLCHFLNTRRQFRCLSSPLYSA